MKQVCAVILALLSLCACGRSAEPPDPHANEPAAAAPPAPAAPVAAEASTPDYYPVGYAEMKAAAAIFAKENFGAFKREQTVDDKTGREDIFYEVEDCQEPFESAEIGESGDRRQLALEALAREIAKRRHYLSQLYSPAVYEEPLRNYEKRVIEEIAKPPSEPYGAEQALADTLEARRKRLEPDSIPVVLGGGCGAGEVAYFVKTQPPNGRVWMTTKFSFDLCRVRKLDPWNTNVCRWTEVSPSQPAYLSGRYVYQARWRNGARRSDVRAFDGFLDPEKGDALEVVIRAP